MQGGEFARLRFPAHSVFLKPFGILAEIRISEGGFAAFSLPRSHPSSVLEELKIGLNGFNELVLPILAAIPRHLAGNGGVPLLKLAVPRLRR